jgi:hypothetical protein
MKVFKAILKKHPTCDYSIEQGAKIIVNIDISVNSMYKAKKIVENIIEEKYSSENTKLISADVIEIKEISKINLSNIYKTIKK